MLQLDRTPLLMEFGPYGPSLKGTSGFASPLGMGRFTTFPFHLGACQERNRQEQMIRRRARLQELARDFNVTSGCAKGDPSDDDGDDGDSKKKQKKRKKRRSQLAARVPGAPEPSPSLSV